MRALILGNAGSGKSTLAQRLAAQHDLAHLCMDAVAFDGGTQRRPVADSIRDARAFADGQPRWVIEGCYADLAAALFDCADRLIFLNPGTAACADHCRQRPWEPDKFDSPEAQNAYLDGLLDWVSAYPTRKDEYGLAAHRAAFNAFEGDKIEYTDPRQYAGAER